jgi:hypothetical protein
MRMPVANGTACDDGMACTSSDVCTAGTCGGTPVDCSGMTTTCATGSCNPTTGACESTPRPDGTNCTDGRACTRGDACDGGVCLGRAGDLAFVGFANWTQAAVTQNNRTQDALMDAACQAAFAGSHAATMTDITRRRVVGLPATNTSGTWAVPKCPACEGRVHTACVEGTARNCVNPGAAWPTSAEPWTGNDNCHTSGRSAVCVIPRIIYAGTANWMQTASMTHAAQDAAMDAACATAFAGSRAVTMDQMVTSTIVGRPATNATGLWLLGRCPNCQGNVCGGCASGFARNCVTPGNAIPTVSNPWPSERNCIVGTRSTMCVRPTRACAFRGFATWTQAASTQSDAAQDAAMNAACSTAFPGSRAATIEELASSAISGRPATNTTPRYLLGRCPMCEGQAHASCVEGYARNCINPGSAFPEDVTPWPPTLEDNCHTTARSALCY